VEQFLHNFDPIDWQMECLMGREMTPEEWELENEQGFCD